MLWFYWLYKKASLPFAFWLEQSEVNRFLLSSSGIYFCKHVWCQQIKMFMVIPKNPCYTKISLLYQKILVVPKTPCHNLHFDVGRQEKVLFCFLPMKVIFRNTRFHVYVYMHINLIAFLLHWIALCLVDCVCNSTPLPLCSFQLLFTLIQSQSHVQIFSTTTQ